METGVEGFSLILEVREVGLEAEPAEEGTLGVTLERGAEEELLLNSYELLVEGSILVDRLFES